MSQLSTSTTAPQWLGFFYLLQYIVSVNSMCFILVFPLILCLQRITTSNLRTKFFNLLRTFCPHLGSFFFFFFHYVSVKFHLWPSSGDLPWPRIVTVSPVITAFHSCCLSHHVFDQVNLWPALVGFETAILWQCLSGTVETQRLHPLRHGPRRNNPPKKYQDEDKRTAINKKINSQIRKPHFKMIPIKNNYNNFYVFPVRYEGNISRKYSQHTLQEEDIYKTFTIRRNSNKKI